ncbi:Antirestriction protein-like protein [Jannaschia sp. CCS1]|nr:Antirestriction protein-like protein [Jannaschia sp. CCS1]
MAHELTHWTSATKRLDRLGRLNDRKAYALEELVAEIGNCMLCAKIGVKPEFDQSAAYVEGWLDDEGRQPRDFPRRVRGAKGRGLHHGAHRAD